MSEVHEDAEIAAEDESGDLPEEAAALDAARQERLGSIIESVLFAAGAPVPLRKLMEILSGPSAATIKRVMQQLAQAYEDARRGMRIVQVAGGYQFRTAPETAEWVRALVRERPIRLGRAALETLAIVAYRQPATRADIEAVRGVDADSALSTLLAKRLIRIAGRKEAVGRPLMYATTPEFLEVFSLSDLAALPALKEIGPVPDNEDDTATDDDAGRGALAEDSQPSGDQLAPGGGGDDPRGPRAGEWPGGGRAGNEGESPPRPHHS